MSVAFECVNLCEPKFASHLVKRKNAICEQRPVIFRLVFPVGLQCTGEIEVHTDPADFRGLEQLSVELLFNHFAVGENGILQIISLRAFH